MTIYKKEKIWYTLYRINSKKEEKYYVLREIVFFSRL